ncbi:MAG: hypothetical protein AMJ62_01780 [Myxococcales bacterium SG8_38]|nr:MAG: hypothetical protein AMJ62_01780 [Myxococcales bacterium SG8_38]
MHTAVGSNEPMGAPLQKVPQSAALLVGLLVLIVVSPSVQVKGAEVVIELIFDLILLAGVYAVRASRHRWTFGALTAITLAIRWGEILWGDRQYDPLYLGLTVAWLAYATWIVVGQLFQRRDVSIDTIFGAITAYLLIAVAFMELYSLIELQRPGSFAGLADATEPNRQQMGGTMLYFSLVCLTTMGFGDIVPASNLARPLAALEGVIGQLYLAIMIARLVGLHISRRND